MYTMYAFRQKKRIIPRFFFANLMALAFSFSFSSSFAFPYFSRMCIIVIPIKVCLWKVECGGVWGCVEECGGVCVCVLIQFLLIGISAPTLPLRLQGQRIRIRQSMRYIRKEGIDRIAYNMHYKWMACLESQITFYRYFVNKNFIFPTTNNSYNKYTNHTSCKIL